MSAIVVGVDGSDESRRALDWALAWARHHGARVRVVYAYNGGESEREAELILNAAVTVAEADGVDVQAEAAPGRPAQVLLEAARDAELLVVGSRGRHGFPGLLLGSTSQQLAHHATCPVLIVPSQAAR